MEGNAMKKPDTVEARAVKVAAHIMQAAGLCRHEHPATQCRKVCVPNEIDCEICIRNWLLAKAKAELRKEGAAV